MQERIVPSITNLKKGGLIVMEATVMATVVHVLTEHPYLRTQFTEQITRVVEGGVELRGKFFVPEEMLTEDQKTLVSLWETENEALHECCLLAQYGEV